MRQLPAIFLIAMALTSVILTRLICGAASALKRVNRPPAGRATAMRMRSRRVMFLLRSALFESCREYITRGDPTGTERKYHGKYRALALDAFYFDRRAVYARDGCGDR